MFFDEAKIHVQAGNGGDGCISFRREKYVPFGGPDGGNGGDGGSVFLVASPHLNTLATFARRSRFKAQSGGRGQGKNCHGKKGADLLIAVPLGTVVYDAETGELLADLVEPGQRVLVAQGGRGGRGNASFATPTDQAPRVATKGDPGEARWLRLELKLIADVGIVGVPNAGKSTLLSVISAARPKIAPYPFTTLEPNLGVVELDGRSFVAADIPGLIEGAHRGEGLGHQFLRHIERTRVLIHLLDGAAADPLRDWEQINVELELFDPRLLRKPQLAVFNKMDLPQARERWPEIKEGLARRGQECMAISAITGEGVRDMLWRVLQLLDSAPSVEEELQEFKVFRPEPVDAKKDSDGYEIVREGNGFRIRGAKIERIAARTMWESDEAVLRFQRILKAMGIYDDLVAAGIQVGDTVYIGDVELEWM